MDRGLLNDSAMLQTALMGVTRWTDCAWIANNSGVVRQLAETRHRMAVCRQERRPPESQPI